MEALHNAAYQDVLLDQVTGLSRAEAMKQVVGPFLDDLLRPIYETGLERHEKPSLYAVTNIRDLDDYAKELAGVLQDRLQSRSAWDSCKRSDFAQLIGNRPDLFYHGASKGALEESVQTGVVMPLTIATQIEAIESGDADWDAPIPDSYFSFLERPYKHSKMIEIMRRGSFDNILTHLTKGPNGFLEGNSSEVDLGRMSFFEFYIDDEGRIPLEVRDAYEKNDGVISGLSDSFFIAANRRRKHLASLFTKLSAETNSKHATIDSSGCPVRHSFNNEVGETQEPLIVTAKNFVISALETTQAA